MSGATRFLGEMVPATLGVLDPGTLAQVWLGICLLGTAASLLLTQALFC